MLCAQDMPDGYVSGDDQLAEQDTVSFSDFLS